MHPARAPAAETTAGGHRFTLHYLPPSEALPLFGRLTAFLAPVLEGAAGEAVRAFIRALDDPDRQLRDLLKSIDASAIVAGAFRVRWGESSFMALAREILGPVQVYDGAVAIPALTVLDDDRFAGPAGLQALLQVIGWATWKQFGLPLSSPVHAGAPPPAAPRSDAPRLAVASPSLPARPSRSASSGRAP